MTNADEAAEGADAAPAPDRAGMVLGLSPAGFHEIACTDWGPLDDPRPIVCVHGLTRQGRDFDPLAAALAARGRRVICPDLPGRGRSGRLRNPDDYALPQYCADMNAVIARLGVREVDWVGTSLGGLIGMIMAGFAGSIVRNLVINDIGPFVSASGLKRIGQYIGSMPASFPTLDAADAYIRTVLAPYGDLSDAQWRHLARHSVRWNAEHQRYDMLCDPAIAKGFRSPWFYPLNLWAYWEAITVPVLVLHGARSDLLSFALTQEMKKRNRGASVFSFDDCGHVPPLMAEEQIAVVTRFILQEAPAWRQPSAGAAGAR
ncbi:alpha/beta hydrolase [Bradyrhizobium sp. U87765 SZCCT0131]|uniref:alpha/beta fold hydrolase n=1 Tax=unclassified Bradyrhizobium TaxID=2631580 RepID=UPI001BAC7E93|nr:MULTISPECIES: alpha/beta hydrolase [unclassified Bradyrhizobium]MBR1217685.1 alpha/beta hydrolase [Bradyrhizobium sp. U87765 SZCCT0131]MBR1261369.1 alpha/beta hydrolase [Bradyrhizobium sp. U87765 SZCCT0134]MBR1303183.1 alpha/beta hydrolase [Bradyrhizobium sp. U87765 SZCCT0110]MBR1318789.1 alpha/beta hydrolase [Bradyrhizobium sp. U87765 SZCCT0109]MBR1347114.1 alpha/beta hydrolase [Bradyrhizobium sp. U87765 SZCCT0048]